VNLFEKLSGAAVERLSHEQVQALRSRYRAVRSRLQPVLKLIHGTFSAADLHRHLAARVDPDFEILMVHSSFNHMLPMFTGTAMDVLTMLVDFCGPRRTLAMPGFSLGDAGASDVVSSYQRKPWFDVRRTPSQMGIVTELFRRSKGVHQSLHPTHRVTAIGPLAEVLTAGHDAAETQCGPGTPFAFMAAQRTLILGIGKPFEVLTQVHYVEDFLGDAFPVPHEVHRVPITLKDERGTERPYTLRVRKFEWRRDMWRLSEIMPSPRLRHWTLHGMPLFATYARDVSDDLLAAAARGLTVFRKPE
jgi:aminoglycoside 3-N-acetyltransferase